MRSVRRKLLAAADGVPAALRAALMFGVLALAGCGGGGSEAPESQPESTATTSATAEETALEHAPALDEAQVRASAVTFKLKEENGSGRTGRAVVQRSDDGGTEVLLALSHRQDETNPAHFHDVSCAAYRRMKEFGDQLATVSDTLESLADGRSTSTVGVPVKKRTTGRYSINVHEPESPYPVVACGDVPRG